MNLFKPKCKKEILENFLWLDVNEFEKRADEFKEIFREDVPKEYYPLIYTIYSDIRKRNVTMASDAFIKRVRGDVTRFHLRAKKGYVSITMFPFRKRKIINKFTFGNEFRITSVEQYLKFLNAYEID